MTKSATTSFYSGKALDKLFNDICECLDNIERVEYLDFDRIVKYTYERETTRHWYRLWIKEFNGTFEEYIKTQIKPKESHLEYSRAYKRMMKLNNLVSDAISLGSNGNETHINLSISDHSFIEVCKVKSDWSGKYHNASLD